MRSVILENQVFKILIALFLFLVLMNGTFFSAPPELRATNRPDQFDTNRAIARIQKILPVEIPHPIGSDENKKTRDRLVAQIRELRFDPVITSNPGCFIHTENRYGVCAQTENVSFRIGPAPVAGEKNTILVTSHYDSVPAGPGVADALLGVGVALEAALHLAQENPARPFLFLLTDGEEVGLLGARAFIDHDPRADEIDIVVNFEARGVRGPAYMFETSQPNGQVMPAFMKNVRRPVANSLMAGIYELLPNSTDVAVYLPEKIKALNFAIIGNEAYYHTPQDNFANLSRISTQHMGDQALTTLRALALKDSYGVSHRLIYTDFLGRGMIAMPQILALPILIGTLIITLIGFFKFPDTLNPGKLIRQSKSQKVSILLSPLLVLITSLGLSYGIQFLTTHIRIEPNYWRAHGWASLGWITLTAILSAMTIPRIFAPSAYRVQIMTAGWFWFLFIGFALSFALPGASIFFVLPALLFATGSILRLVLAPAGALFQSLASIFALFLWAPTIATFGISLGYGIGFIICLICAIALLPWLGILKQNPQLTQPSRLPDTSQLSSVKQIILSPTKIVLFLIVSFWLAAILMPAYSVVHPRHMNALTLVDGDNAWVSFGSSPAAPPNEMRAIGTIQKAKALVPEFNTFAWYADAVAPNLPKPDVLNLTTQPLSEGSRTISYQLTPSDADRITMTFPNTLFIKKLKVNEKEISIEPDERGFTFRCIGHFCKTMKIQIDVEGNEVQSLFLYAEYFTPSETAKTYIEARPKTAIARQSGDRTMVVNRLML